jgi:putative glycosyltransferase (TIGR04348 family)
MKIAIVTPAPAGSRAGNRVTALRWARILRSLGHRVTVTSADDPPRCDILIALHARRSAAAIARFRRDNPTSPLVVALTGTDLYRDIQTSRPAQRSLALADRLVLLQEDGASFLPASVQDKVCVIYQSAPPPRRSGAPLARVFEVTVVGHLRTVKDPFRAALAARRLPESSRVGIVQIGAALTPAMADRAQREMAINPRYRWLGEMPHARTRARLARSRLLVVTSKIEGAANVASEALAARVPILATRISGLIGLLGPDYPGYFSVGDTPALTDLLNRAETDSDFYRKLRTACATRRPLVDPRRERRAWRDLVTKLTRPEK